MKGIDRLLSRLGGTDPDARFRAEIVFGVGALLGLIWLPCVGPTLGAAIALASVGQQLSTAFLIMLACFLLRPKGLFGK